jgi:hypothetical protein
MADETWVALGGQWVQVSTQTVTDHAEFGDVNALDAHPVSAITGLDAQLALKADVTHSHGSTYMKVTVNPAAPANPKVGDIWIVDV